MDEQDPQILEAKEHPDLDYEVHVSELDGQYDDSRGDYWKPFFHGISFDRKIGTWGGYLVTREHIRELNARTFYNPQDQHKHPRGMKPWTTASRAKYIAYGCGRVGWSCHPIGVNRNAQPGELADVPTQDEPVVMPEKRKKYRASESQKKRWALQKEVGKLSRERGDKLNVIKATTEELKEYLARNQATAVSPPIEQGV